MTRRRLLRRAVPAVIAAAALFAGAARAGSDPQVPGEVLLRLSSAGALGPLLTRHGLTLAGQFGSRPIYRVKLVGNGDTAPVIQKLLAEPAVLGAEPNTVQSTPEARKNVVWAIGSAADYAAQWAPQALNLPAAQLLSSGAGVRVAVLDTGVDIDHPALAGRLLPGWDFVDGDADPAERGSSADAGYGHGTHVAGLVALAAPGAKIIPLRVLDAAGRGNVWVLAEAMLKAIEDGSQVINVSIGTAQKTEIVRSVIALATCQLPPAGYGDPGYNGDRDRCGKSPGVVIVAAAGNDGSRSALEYPAAENEDGLLAVGASAAGGSVAGFSNSGSWVGVAAPGDHVTSSVPGGGYGTWSGTSMASPLAAGVAALLRARHPTLPAKELARRLPDTAVRLCGGTNLKQIDALAALTGVKPAQPGCR